MSCRHKQIRTWVFADTKEPSGLWSCVDCGLKFEPIKPARDVAEPHKWVGLTEEEVIEISFNFDVSSLVVRTIEAKLREKNEHMEKNNG